MRTLFVVFLGIFAISAVKGEEDDTVPPPPPLPSVEPSTAPPSANFELVGCYSNGRGKTPHPIPRWVGNFNHPHAMFHPEKVIRACAERVQKRGDYKYFGISHLGACWTGKDADKTYDMYGKSTACLSGLGYTGALSVYRFI